MDLSRLVKSMCTVALLGTLACSRSVQSEPAKDSMPPSVDVTMQNNSNGRVYLEIKIKDSFPGEARIAPNVERGYQGTSNSHGLQKVELYNGAALVDSFPLDGNIDATVTYTITQPDGEFTYKVVAYDRAGNKTTAYLPLTFIDGVAKDSQVLKNDKSPPYEVSIKIKNKQGIMGTANDNQSGVRALHLYEGTTLIQNAQGNSLSFDKAQIGKTYHLEAEDFAGNKASSEPLRFTYHKLVPAECVVPRCLDQ